MSQIRQTSLPQMSFSMIAILASSIALSACSKHSAMEKSTADKAGTTQTAEVPQAQQEAVQAATLNQCPSILGTFTNAAGDEVTYTMASVEGGVSYTRNGQVTIADGKSHTTAGNVTESYVATCASNELKIVSTQENGETSTRTVKVEEIGDGGDVNLHMEVDGVGSTTPLKKVVKASVPETVPEATDDSADKADDAPTAAVDSTRA